MIMNKFGIVAALAASFALAGCDVQSEPKTAKDVQAEKAAAAANSIKFNENAEIDNIKQRLELTSNPGQIGFVLLLNEMGKPVMYASVKGKITSGGKRLTRPQEFQCLGVAGGGCSYEVVEAPSDEGTYGNSTPYVFFWTTDGQYFQWAGKYLYSDKPFRISDPTIVVLTSNSN
jgi:hypothetical protein